MILHFSYCTFQKKKKKTSWMSGLYQKICTFTKIVNGVNINRLVDFCHDHR